MQTEKTISDIVLLACEQYKVLKNMQTVFNNLYETWGKERYPKHEFKKIIAEGLVKRRNELAEIEEWQRLNPPAIKTSKPLLDGSSYNFMINQISNYGLDPDSYL